MYSLTFCVLERLKTKAAKPFFALFSALIFVPEIAIENALLSLGNTLRYFVLNLENITSPQIKRNAAIPYTAPWL
jgi:hypothetical protein